MPFSDSQIDKYEHQFTKKTKRPYSMCSKTIFEFSMDPLGMFTVDVRTVVKMLDLERGRVIIFVNCKDCGYYIFFKSGVVEIA
jgi:hypothetical protein